MLAVYKMLDRTRIYLRQKPFQSLRSKVNLLFVQVNFAWK
jgi:hypothetical protein